MTDVTQTDAISSQSKVGSGGDRSDTVIATIISVLIIGSLLTFIVLYQAGKPDPRLFLFLAGIMGAALGWGTGILLSPYEGRETGLFGGVGKTVTGIISGYLAAKLEPIVSAWVGRAKDQGILVADQLVIAVVLTTFVTACAITYISRRY